MRLGQLARHLETTTTDIIQYLAEKGVEKKDHPNVKLTEDDEATVIAHFRPDLLANENIQESKEESPSIPPEQIEAVPESKEEPRTKTTEITIEEVAPTEQKQETTEVLETVDPIESKDVQIDAEDQEENPYANVDVIKAPKIELPGLKVVGKIELPEPKPKVTEAEENTPEEETTEAPAAKEPKVIRHNRKNSRRALTDEEREARRLRNKKEKEKRLAKQAARQKEQEQRHAKKLKEDHYKQKINKPVSAKPKKKKPTKYTSEEVKPKPKTLLGKFWRWLNT